MEEGDEVGANKRGQRERVKKVEQSGTKGEGQKGGLNGEV